MKAGSNLSLWATAFGVSIGLHGAIAAVLALTPRLEGKPEAVTYVTVQPLPQDMPGAVAGASAAPVAAASETAKPVWSPVEAAQVAEGETVAAAGFDGVASGAVTETGSIAEAVQTAEVARRSEPAGPAPVEHVRQPELVSGMKPAAAEVAAIEPTQDIAPASVPDSVEVTAQLAPGPSAVGAERVATPIADAAPDVVQPGAALTPVFEDTRLPAVQVEAAAASEALKPAAPTAAPAGGLTAREVPDIATPGRAAESSITAAAPARDVAAVAQAALRPAAAVAAPSARAVGTASDGMPAAAGPQARPSVAIRPVPAERAELAAASVGSPQILGGAAETVGAAVALLPSRPAGQIVVVQPLPDPAELVMRIIAEQPEQSCFMAVASQAGEAIEVNGYAAAPQALTRLGQELAAVPAEVGTRQHQVTQAQCEALSFARSATQREGAALAISTGEASIASGGELSGAVHNLRRKYLYLLVVDDEGKVQEVSGLYVVDPRTVGFRAAFTLTHGPVETVQLLVAIASDTQLGSIARHEGDAAGTYFASLAGEIAAAGGGADVGVTAFTIR